MTIKRYTPYESIDGDFDGMGEDNDGRWVHYEAHLSDKQQAVNEALERAAQVCIDRCRIGSRMTMARENEEAMECAAAIRALKGAV